MFNGLIHALNLVASTLLIACPILNGREVVSLNLYTVASQCTCEVIIVVLLAIDFVDDGNDLGVQVYTIAMTLVTICKPSIGTMRANLIDFLYVKYLQCPQVSNLPFHCNHPGVELVWDA